LKLQVVKDEVTSLWPFSITIEISFRDV